MKTSARNRLAGQVSAVRAGAVNDEIELVLPGGQRLVAVVTHESAQALGLRVGVEASALVKASSVLVAVDLGSAKLSARNRFDGTVRAVTPGAVNAEITIDAGGGVHIAAIVTQASLLEMGLKPGDAATAFFKASSVILAVPA